jgi:hypothetical protein
MDIMNMKHDYEVKWLKNLRHSRSSCCRLLAFRAGLTLGLHKPILTAYTSE